MVKAIAHRYSYDIVYIDDIKSCNSGGISTEKRTIFVFDEIDMLLNSKPAITFNFNTGSTLEHNNIKTFISFIDNVSDGNIIIATTNNIDSIDDKVKRDARFDIKFCMDGISTEMAYKMGEHYRASKELVDEFIGDSCGLINPSSLQTFLIKKKSSEIVNNILKK